MKIKKWEVFLAILLVCVFAFSFTAKAVSDQQQGLALKLIRLHVIANSDTEEDQTVKLAVRDSVNAYLAELLSGCKDREKALEIIDQNLHSIQCAASETVSELGREHTVEVCISDEYYPTRQYEGFSLPAGKYTSLQIRIGEADGKNWWCVVFPPICTSAVSTELLTDVDFSESEIEFITEDNSSVVFKFKLLEILESIRYKWKN